MRAVRLTILTWAAALAASIAASAQSQKMDSRVEASTADGSSIEMTAKAIEDPWPRDITGYCLSYEKILSGLKVSAKGEADIDLMERLVNQLLRKEPPIATDDGNCFSLVLGVQRRAIESLLDAADRVGAPAESRLRHAEMVDRYLSHLGDLIAEARNAPEPRSWAVLIESGSIPLGPAAASDPGERKAFSSAVTRYYSEIDKAQRGRLLRKMLPLMDYRLTAYLKATVEKFPGAAGAANKLLQRRIAFGKGPDYIPRALK